MSLSHQKIKYFSILATLWASLLLAVPAIAQDTTALTYFDIRDPNDSASSSSIDQALFTKHLAHLADSGTAVIAPEHLFIEKTGKSVLLTFETTRRDVIDRVMPLLKQYQFPALLLISTDKIGLNDTQLDWSYLKELNEQDEITIGLNGCHYTDLTALSDDDLAQCLNRAIATYQEHMGHTPTFFSLPNGTYTQSLLSTLRGYGIQTIFGHQSGVINHRTPVTAILPRFSMTQSYADLVRFQRVIGAYALPVTNLLPTDNIISQANLPAIGFTVLLEGFDATGLSCFLSDHGTLDYEVLGENRIELRLPKDISIGRKRLNCTYKTPTSDTPLYWFGMLFDVRD